MTQALQLAIVDGAREDDAQRQPLGIDGLDALLEGGLPPGNAVLVQGAPGTGKTLLGMQFLWEGACRWNEPGLLVLFEEQPWRVYRDAHALGWDFERLERERKLFFVFTSPSVFLKELQSDFYSDLAREHGLRRIVVDSLTQFECLPAMEDLRICYQRVVNGLRRDDLSLMLIREAETREAKLRVGPEEYIADTIIQLEYRLVGDRRMRSLEILKHRGSGHSSLMHPFVIGPGGLRILPMSEG